MNRSRSTVDWHARFLEQAEWTSYTRNYLFQHYHLNHSTTILEVGCGTGVITHSLHQFSEVKVFGIDLVPDRVKFARKFDCESHFSAADGRQLPFQDKLFDATICHFYLMWVPNPLQAIQEMRRVTKLGGSVIFLAEPFYRHRIDYPTSLEKLGEYQAESLVLQGADPNLGVRLPEFMLACGFKEVHFGLPGGEWFQKPSSSTLTTENWVLRDDLKLFNSKLEIDALLHEDQLAESQGKRILFVPTFYAVGKVDS